MVKSKINKLIDLWIEQKKFYEHAMVDFFNDMSLAWASDVAVEEYKFLTDLIGDHIVAMAIGYNETVNFVISAANTWLTTLDSEDGAPETIGVTFEPIKKINRPDIAIFKDQLENGNKGMETDAVNAIYDIFKTKCKMHLAMIAHI